MRSVSVGGNDRGDRLGQDPRRRHRARVGARRRPHGARARV